MSEPSHFDRALLIRVQQANEQLVQYVRESLHLQQKQNELIFAMFDELTKRKQSDG